MEKIKYYPLIDEKPNTQKIKEYIQSHIAEDLLFTENLDDANAILVWWGDGFMLDMIKKYISSGKPFVGINYGTLWFLLNNIKDFADIPTDFSQLELVHEKTPSVEIIDSAWQSHHNHVINDVILWGKQWILDFFGFHVYNDEWIDMHIKGTGLFVSTPIWSTAYRLKSWWPVMPLNSELWGVMGVCSMPFHHKIIEPQELTIDVTSKSSAITWVDGFGNGYYPDVRKVIIRKSEQWLTLGFRKEEQFAKKRILIAQNTLAKNFTSL